MLEVTCSRCGNIVHIAPDAPLCSVCGSDLGAQISPAAAADYFYARAADLVASKKPEQALGEVNRGLAYIESSQLHLLGAILCKRLGDVDRMRRHVAAIPVDDSLRDEAEWLLRSHQERQRSGRDPAPPAPSGAPPAPAAAGTKRALPPPPPPRRQSVLWAWLLGALLLIALGAGLWLLIGRGDSTLATPQGAAPTPTVLSAAAAAEDAPTTEEPTPVPTDAAAATPMPTATATPQPTATAEVFDWPGYLGAAGGDELLDAPVKAALVGGLLTLQGVVPSARLREALVKLAAEHPMADAVDAAELVITPPPTYTVEAGDTLWSITTEFYGDTVTAQTLFDFNQDALTSPDAIRVGTVLKLPPLPR